MDIQNGMDHIGTKPHDAQAHAIGSTIIRNTDAIIADTELQPVPLTIQGNRYCRRLPMAGGMMMVRVTIDDLISELEGLLRDTSEIFHGTRDE